MINKELEPVVEKLLAFALEIARISYVTGHNDTVESCYNLDEKEVVRDIALDIAQDMGLDEVYKYLLGKE